MNEMRTTPMHTVLRQPKLAWQVANDSNSGSNGK